jgi:hypothetical protein
MTIHSSHFKSPFFTLQRCLLTLFLFLQIASISAQELFVFYAKGSVYMSHEGKRIQAERGLAFHETATLIIGAKAVAILYQNERSLTVRDSGAYSFSDLTEMFAASKSSISDEYIAYIWNQENEPENETDKKSETSIIFPVDSSIVINETFKLQVVPKVVPGYLFLYQQNQPVTHLKVDEVAADITFGGALAKDVWYGMAMALNEQAPDTATVYVKWAGAVEQQDLRMNMAELLAAIEDYPKEVKDEVITAFLTSNKLVYYTPKD